MRRGSGIAGIVAGLVLCGGILDAHAQAPLSTPVEPEDRPGGLEAGPVTFRGRVEGRANAADDEQWSRNYDVRAILGADFEQGDWLRGQAELQVSAFPELRDAWLRVKLPRRLSLQAGRFRPPFGRLEQTSRWDLPLVRRGAMSEQAQDELGYGGRRTGVMFKAKGGKTRGRATFELGVFQGDRLSDGSRAEDLVARVTGNVLPWLSLGAGSYVRGAFQAGATERFLFGVDALATRGAFEWLGEVQAGAEFTGLLAMVAWRAEAPSMSGWWVQPALVAELVRSEADATFRPLVTPTLNSGRGGFRARVSLELGSAREPVGSARFATLLLLVGSEF